jgi:NAD(P)-dependent dehydrogenase (short-subunit alcohol dehydrogenase family)
MRVFVTGASGWIGSATVVELIGAGHQVLGLVRSDASAAALAALGAEVQRGTIDELYCAPEPPARTGSFTSRSNTTSLSPAASKRQPTLTVAPSRPLARSSRAPTDRS